MKADDEKNKLLFDNIINRILQDESCNKYSLPGVITVDEYSALIYAQKLVSHRKDSDSDNTDSIENTSQGVKPTSSADNIERLKVTHETSRVGNIKEDQNTSRIAEIQNISVGSKAEVLDLSVLSPTDFLPDIKLGLDFGTAYSKACMIKVSGNEENILDLALGIFAGEDSLEMPVHSSLFIDPDGRLYFGPLAVEKSLEARSKGLNVSRIDSIKSFLIDEDRVTVDDSPLEKIFNPTDVEISKATLLTFYLGYLLNLVREVASESHGIDIGEVRQRVSLPCYNGDHRAKVVNEISRLFAFGEVLGKSFTQEWESGFELSYAVELYEWMRSNVTLCSPYIEVFLEEPLAVAGSRLAINGVSTGNVCMVVDVGAGTTDFAMFEIFSDNKKDNIIATEIKGSEYGIPVAGDKLDKILLSFILREAGIRRDNEDYQEVVLSLRLDIRNYKEQLFKKNELTYSLPNGIHGQVKLSDFMQDKSVRDYTLELKDAFIHVLESIHPSWVKTKIRQKNAQSKLPVILTGGGAHLPMIKNLSKGTVDVAGYAIELFPSPIVPKWIDDEYDGEIINLYPQLAVAIGGAKQFVIQKTGVQKVFT